MQYINTHFHSAGRSTEARGHKPGLLHLGPRPHAEGELGHHRAVQGSCHHHLKEGVVWPGAFEILASPKKRGLVWPVPRFLVELSKVFKTQPWFENGSVKVIHAPPPKKYNKKTTTFPKKGDHSPAISVHVFLIIIKKEKEKAQLCYLSRVLLCSQTDKSLGQLFQVKVKLYLGPLAGELAAELPFTLMHPKVLQLFKPTLTMLTLLIMLTICTICWVTS